MNTVSRRPARRDERNFWPWRDWMTIGIGVLGSKDRKPDHVILVSDTMGSADNSYSTDELHKGWHFPDVDLYAVGAGSIDLAAQLMATIHVAMKSLKPDRSYGDVLRTVQNSYYGYRLTRFSMELGPQLMFTGDQWFQVMDPEFRNTILHHWTTYDVGFDLIIGSFAKNGEYRGQAFLLHVSGQDGKVNTVTFPGACAIGTGQDNANFWLMYRQQKMGFSVERAAYHAYEAKLMAETSPVVNERTEMLIASVDGKHYSLRHNQQSVKGCPVSLPQLANQYKKYGPQGTAKLDPPGQAEKMVY